MTINWEHNVNVAEDKGEGEKLEPLEELPEVECNDEDDDDGTVTVTVKSEEVEEEEEA